jgi:hypothetical protein
MSFDNVWHSRAGFCLIVLWELRIDAAMDGQVQED